LAPARSAASYGARLSTIHDVTLIGGAAHVEAIQRDGLVMQGQYDRHAARCRRSPRVPSIEPGTLILLTAKVNNNIACVAPIVDLLTKGVTIVCVQTGCTPKTW
jgi:ketopantoate reductase